MNLPKKLTKNINKIHEKLKNWLNITLNRIIKKKNLNTKNQ